MGQYDVLKEELSKDFTAEDVARLPEYMEKEEEEYGKRQRRIEVVVAVFVLLSVAVFYLASTFYGFSVTLSNDYLAIIAVLILLPIVLAAVLRPSKSKARIVKVGRDQLTKEERLRLYARMEVQVKKARERRGEAA